MHLTSGLLPGHLFQRGPRGASATLTGACSASGPIEATVFSGSTPLRGLKKQIIGQARGGKFTAKLRGLPTGGPYRVVLSRGPDRIEVDDIFVGDLWLMAGQSNMQGCGRFPAAVEPHPLVRCFTLARRWEQAIEPLHFKVESPDPVHNPEGVAPGEAAELKRNALTGTGVGLPFARLLAEKTGVPQGLIATAQGGSSMEQWNPALKRQGGRSLYGSMWLSLKAIGQPLAGVLWYQGESEASPEPARVYTARMKRLVAAVRRDLGQPRLPWLMVQLGRVIKGGHLLADNWPDVAAWNSIQEQQRLLPKSISRCAVVPAIDLPLDDLIHLGSAAFPTLASRLAQAAESFLIGRPKTPPSITPARIQYHPAGRSRPAPAIEVTFHGVQGALRSPCAARGFTILSTDGAPIPLIFRTALEGNRAILHLSFPLPEDARLSYGHGLDPVCELGDDSGMAVPVFGPLEITAR